MLVNGRKQGVTKKTMDKPSSISALCKKSMLDAFKVLRRYDDGGNLATSTYGHLKSEAIAYQRLWTARKNLLGCWTEKPSWLLEFT